MPTTSVVCVILLPLPCLCGLWPMQLFGLRRTRRGPRSPTASDALGATVSSPRRAVVCVNRPLAENDSNARHKGGERSEPGEGVSAGTTLTLLTLRVGPLPLPRCGRGARGRRLSAPAIPARLILRGAGYRLAPSSQGGPMKESLLRRLAFAPGVALALGLALATHP